MKGKTTRTPSKEPASALLAAYPIAQRLAAKAVHEWAVDCGGDWSDRGDHIAAVYAALVKGELDPSKTLHAGLGGNRELSDTVGALMAVSEDAGFLYGLAVGLALKNGGAK